MSLVHYLPNSEYSRLLPEGMQPVLRRDLFAAMLRVNALARCLQHRQPVSTSSLDNTLRVYSDVCSTDLLHRHQLLIESNLRNPAMAALRHALGYQSDLFDEELTASPEQPFRAVTPGHTLSLAIGTALARSLREPGARTIALLSSTQDWVQSAALPLPEAHRKFLKRLVVVAPLTPEQCQDEDELELRLFASGWTVVHCQADEIVDTLEKTSYLQSPMLLLYPQTQELTQDEISLTTGIFPDSAKESAAGDLLRIACDELDVRLAAAGLPGCELEICEVEGSDQSFAFREDLRLEVTRELLQQMAAREDLFVIDATHESDRYLRAIDRDYSQRRLRANSMREAAAQASGLAADGLLPVIVSETPAVHAAARLDGRRVIYISLDAGLHSADTTGTPPDCYDIAQFVSHNSGAIIEPSTTEEALSALRFALNSPGGSFCLRLQGGLLSPEFILPQNYYFSQGRGSLLRAGEDAVVFAYGPSMLAECLRAADLLADHEFSLAVVNLPWLNRLDLRWLRPLISSYEQVHIVEDHASVGALGDEFLRECTKHGLLERRQVHFHGADLGATTLSGEAMLRYYGLDYESLAASILKAAGERRLSRKALQAARKLREHTRSTETEESLQDSLLDIDLKLLKSL